MSWSTAEQAPLTGPTSPIGEGIARELAAGGLEAVCDLDRTAEACVAAEQDEFVLCRWVPSPEGDVRTLVARPLPRLAAMALLVPGSLSTRVDRTSAVMSAEDGRPTLDGDADAIARMVVDALRTGHHLMALRSEWVNALGVADTTYDTTYGAHRPVLHLVPA